MKRLWWIPSLILTSALLLSACVAPAAGTTPAATSGESSGEAKDFITWYQFDQNNQDPASDEHVGNDYMRTSIPAFNEQFKGKWNWINQPKAFDKMTTELIAAVQSGGEVPDVMHIGTDDLLSFTQNGTIQDLTDWAKAQSWYSDLDPNALAVCQGPDGKLYCIPVAQTPQIVFVWKDRFPDGYPTTLEDFMTQAEKIKADGHYAITFMGSTDYDGLGLTRFVWTAISSFGGKFDDGNGKMTLNTPENVAAIQFMRDLVTKQYAPEVAFAGKFQEESAFKDASAGSFPTGMFGYRYVNPLTAPSGKKYEKGNEEDMIDAINAGDVYLAPFFGANGHKPGCGTAESALVIPNGAKNVDAAHDYINWIMSPEQNAEWVLTLGAGFPTLKTTESQPQFQTDFYKEAAKVVDASVCTPWYGSLTRHSEAETLIMNTVYKLIKQDTTADIASTLTAAEEEYNKGN